MVNLRRMKKLPSTSTDHPRSSSFNPPEDKDKENNKALANTRNFGNDISNISNKIPEKPFIPAKFQYQAGKRTVKDAMKQDLIPIPAFSSTCKKLNRPKLRLKEDPLKDVPLWDRSRISDPQQVGIYAASITAHMLSLEQDPAYKLDPFYMDYHPDLNPKIRRIIIEWLIESHYKYRMNPEVLYLCVNIIDRFLSNIKDFERDEIQLLGVTSLLIASKFEEIYPPSLQRLIYLSEDAVSLEEVLALEGKILKILDFKLIGPSANRFFNRFAEICDLDEKMKVLCKCLMDLMLLEYTSLRFKMSEIAGAAILVAMKMMKGGTDEKMMKERVGYDVEELKSCSNLMVLLFVKMVRNERKFLVMRAKYGGGMGWNVFDLMK